MEDITKVIGVSAVLLPVSGVCVRSIALATGTTQVNSPWSVALDESTGNLIATGIFALLPFVLPLIGVFGAAVAFTPAAQLSVKGRALRAAVDRIRDDLARLHRAELLAAIAGDIQNVERDRAALEDRMRSLESEVDTLVTRIDIKPPPWAWIFLPPRLTGRFLIPAIIIYGSLVLMLPGWPHTAFYVAAIVAVYIALPRILQSTGHLAPRYTLPLLTAIAACATISAGLTGSAAGLTSGYYFLSQSVTSVAASGQYVRVGQVDSEVLLATCKRNPQTIIGVDSTEILAFKITPTSARATDSLLTVLIRHRGPDLGFTFRCP